MTTPYSEPDDRGRYGDDTGYGQSWRGRRRAAQGDRGLLERAGDEVRSWFGDDKAGQRRHRDEYETERHFRQGEHWRPRGSESGIRAGDMMSRNVITVFPDDPVERAALMMRNCDCGALPVVNINGRLIGMVTDRDIAMRLVASGANTRRAIVADCMSDKTFFCHVNDRLEDCMKQMSRHQIRRMPITNDDGQIVGIISQGDLARRAEAYQGRGERRRFADLVSEISRPSLAPYR
ncbi:MAG: CBS domain-containing protein [Blastocatellia bacterium]